jgi:rhamnopyranosyl-N-acetylglucosaminyl-diphospho-decaprenol beta-1,3/1,4-galactofuranosyltransferase
VDAPDGRRQRAGPAPRATSVEACGIRCRRRGCRRGPTSAARAGSRSGCCTRSPWARSWVWLADDDGRAADESTLATLLEVASAARAGRGVTGGRRPRRPGPPGLPACAEASPGTARVAALGTAEGADPDLLPGIASFFNGALFRASTLEVIGVPDLRLFVRGDEVEMHRRMVRSGLPFGTALQATYLHPYGSDEFKPMLGGRLHAQDPGDEVKRYYTYRNRGYLMSQPGMRRIGILELPRFAWYFLVTKRDPRAFRDWLTLLRQGRREQFHRAP